MFLSVKNELYILYFGVLKNLASTVLKMSRNFSLKILFTRDEKILNDYFF